ncbi:unnamed protein product [Discosporangium mesarthrocarpum]
MSGLDMVYYETGNPSILSDAYSTANGAPILDDCESDWTLHSVEQEGGGIIFEGERDLDTKDSHDWPLNADDVEYTLPTRVAAAWGDEELVSYHMNKRVGAAITLFGDVPPPTDVLADIKAEPGMQSYDVAPVDYLIPTNTTTYEITCLNSTQLEALGVPTNVSHVVGFEAIIDTDTEPHIHHLVLKGYTDESCMGLSSDIYVWASGSPSGQAMPDEAGFRFGFDRENDFKSIGVETHYDNPTAIEGLLDSSGVRVFWTENLRQYDAGVMQLGDPFVLLSTEPEPGLPMGKSMYSFSCPSSCTEEFQDESVTVFLQSLHMHEAGARMVTRHYRNDELYRVAEVEYYDFRYSGAFPVNVVDVTIERGDRFETDCYYETSDQKTFGLGSENEMCIDFLYYYPAQELPTGGYCGFGGTDDNSEFTGDLCGGEMTGFSALPEDSDLGRTFGLDDGGVCEVLEEEGTLSGAPRAMGHAGDVGLWVTAAVAGAGALAASWAL